MTISNEKNPTTANTTPTRPAGRREWIGLGVLALASVLAAFASTAGMLIAARTLMEIEKKMKIVTNLAQVCYRATVDDKPHLSRR